MVTLCPFTPLPCALCARAARAAILVAGFRSYLRGEAGLQVAGRADARSGVAWGVLEQQQDQESAVVQAKQQQPRQPQ